MIKNWLNWRTLFACIAIIIVSSSIFYSNYLAQKIEKEERRKIEQWAEAVKINLSNTNEVSTLTAKVLAENSADIPVIVTNEKDSILDYRNIDTASIKTNPT